MTARSTHLVFVPGLGCTEDLFAEQIATFRGDIAISVRGIKDPPHSCLRLSMRVCNSDDISGNS
jgi:hypothetical protein